MSQVDLCPTSIGPVSSVFDSFCSLDSFHYGMGLLLKASNKPHVH